MTLNLVLTLSALHCFQYHGAVCHQVHPRRNNRNKNDAINFKLKNILIECLNCRRLASLMSFLGRFLCNCPGCNNRFVTT